MRNNLNKVLILLLFIIATHFETLGQSNIPMLFFKDRYEKAKVSRIIADSENIKIIGASSIYQNHQSPINLDLYRIKLKKLIPNRYDNSLLCIDIENYQYDDLKSSNSKKLNLATKAFVELIELTRRERPNLRIGIYGLPFPYYYSYLNKNQDLRKFDKILSRVDVLFPSLYIYYPANQKSIKSNLEYFDKNLDLAFRLGSMHNKPIYPFFWYLVHPSNKKYSYYMLPKDEVFEYINHIREYRNKGRKVSGIVWWDTETPYKKNSIKNSKFKDMSSSLINYFK